MENHEYEQHEQHDASPEEMMAALLSANRELTSRVEALTRRLTESGTKLQDDRPTSDQSPEEAVKIFTERYHAGSSRTNAIAAAVADRFARAKTREQRKEAALVAFGGEFEKAERIRRLEKELAEAKGADLNVEIPVDEEA